MKFIETKIRGAYVIELEPREDDRGSLVRTWDKAEFERHGIDIDLVEGYASYTNRKGTLRGLHYQAEPYAEAKLTRCTKGSFFEVVLDLRPESGSYGRWIGLAFAESENRMLYVPPMCAHAILTLADGTELVNFSSRPYAPECERGVRYDDPRFNIRWPIEVTSVSAKDAGWEDFRDHRG
jgi:dTDP-4-dehydrorhamnose 3,5-epimerase